VFSKLSCIVSGRAGGDGDGMGYSLRWEGNGRKRKKPKFDRVGWRGAGWAAVELQARKRPPMNIEKIIGVKKKKKVKLEFSLK